MVETLLIVAIVLLLAVAGIQVMILRRQTVQDIDGVENAFDTQGALERSERTVREEIARNRQESAESARQARDELAASLKGATENLGAIRETIEQRLGIIHEESGKKLDQVRGESAASAQKAREEVALSLAQFKEALTQNLGEIGSNQRSQLGNVVEQLARQAETVEKRLEALRATVDERLKLIQEDNAKQLEQMRVTVDEKLQGTLEQRLGESFKLVSERLEQVHKGLGEMQVLASGVGDLKRVLSNVKVRGTWGEGQLRAMLEEILTPEQFGENICTKEGSERVEFAIRLPGTDDGAGIWLPVDAKFPMEDYQRMLDAVDQADPVAAEAAGRALEARIKGCADDIRRKYINPPITTDFGILFLPIESLFAEVIRRPGLMDYVQSQCNVVIAGPTTLWSLLNSFQMGFRTLAIQKRSSDVWKLLGAVKTEWSKYGEILDRVQKKLTEASNTIDEAQRRTRVIGKKLKDVEQLPMEEPGVLLEYDNAAEPEEQA